MSKFYFEYCREIYALNHVLGDIYLHVKEFARLQIIQAIELKSYIIYYGDRLD